MFNYSNSTGEISQGKVVSIDKYKVKHSTPLSRDNLFTPESYLLTDLCINAVLPSITIPLYMALESFIWRSTSECLEELSLLISQGKVIAYVSQQTLADILGISRERINKYIAMIRKLGWISYSPQKHRECLVYILGNKSRLFRDSWLHTCAKKIKSQFKVDELAEIPYLSRRDFMKQEVERTINLHKPTISIPLPTYLQDVPFSDFE